MRYYNQRGKGRPNASRPGQNRKDHIPKGCQCTKSTHCPGDPAKRICIACQCYLRGEGPLNPNNFSGYSNAKGTGCGRCNRTQYRIDNNIPLSTQDGDYNLTLESEWVLDNQPCNTGCKCNRYENPIGRPYQGQYRYECERKMATPTRFSRFAGQETGGGEVMSVQDFINDIP